MPAVTGPAMQNSTFLPHRSPKPSPVLAVPTQEGWPGLVAWINIRMVGMPKVSLEY